MSLAINKNSMRLLFLIVATLIIFSFILSPTIAYAGGNNNEQKEEESTTETTNANDPSQIGVTIDDNGSLSVNIGGFTSTGGSKKAWNDFILKYKGFITGVAGVGAVTMVVLFIFQFMKLGASAGNPSARSQALAGVLWTGIAAAGLGAVAIIVGFFYNAVR